MEKKRASVEDLLSKPKRTKELQVGEVTVLFGALGSRVYDDLIAAHPPKKGEKDAVWNGDTFPPALIAASALEPVIDEDQATQLWTSTEWSRGELMELFTTIVKLNVEGLNVPFGDNG